MTVLEKEKTPSIENSKPLIKYDPKIEDWMHKEEKDFRQNAGTYILEAKKMGFLPEGEIKKITNFSAGQTSIVFKVETDFYSYVVKMSRKPDDLQVEAKFFEEWQKQGVKTPKIKAVYQKRENLPVTIEVMEYIEAPSLRETTAEERLKKGIAREMGTTLAKMHQATGEGYGLPITENNTIKGKYKTFSEQMDEAVFGERTKKLLNDSIIDQETYDKMVQAGKQAVETIEKDIAHGRKPSLIHYDYVLDNIFYTRPQLTVFDPSALVTHHAIGLARALINKQNEPYEEEAKKELLEGYREVIPISDELVNAGCILRTIMLIGFRARKGKSEKVTQLVDELDEYIEKLPKETARIEV